MRTKGRFAVAFLCVALPAVTAACDGRRRPDTAPPDSAVGPDPNATGVRRWAEWPVPNATGTGLPNPQRYTALTVGSDEVVRDEVTGLVWERRLDGQRFPWPDAVAHCDDLKLASFDDWRLPSRIELVSILDLTHTNPSIDLMAFPDTTSDWYWTASVEADSPDRAWFVFFYFGYPDTDPRANQYSVRCVRGSGAASGDARAIRYDLGAGTVTDRATLLTWQRAVPPGPSSFSDASQYCANLNLDGRADWRLPSLREFETIVDEGRSGPATDPEVFPDTPAEGFWSGTLWAGTSELAWHVDFQIGNAAYDRATMPYRVRCVR